MKVQNLHFEIKFHETKSFFQSIWLFFGSPKLIVIMRHPGSENGEKMLLLMGLFEQKRLLATFIPNPWQLQLHYMSRCQRVVEDWASMRLTFKIQSHRTRSPIFRKQHISVFRVLRNDENAKKKSKKAARTPWMWHWTASPASILTLFRLSNNCCDEFAIFFRRQESHEVWCLDLFARPECDIDLFRFFRNSRSFF